MTSKSATQRKKEDKKDDAHATGSSPCVASIASLLEGHRAAISAEFKMAFSSLEEKLTKTEATVEDHGQRIIAMETNAELLEQQLQTLEEKYAMLADNNAKLSAKAADLEGHSQRNNIRIIGLLEAIDGPQQFFLDLLVELLSKQVLQSPPELDRAHRALATRPPPGGKP